MKLCIFILILFISINLSSASTIAEDNFNRVNNSDVGSNWTDESGFRYQILDNMLNVIFCSTTEPVINNNISISQTDFTINFTFINTFPSVQNNRLTILFNLQNNTRNDDGGCAIEMRENDVNAHSYWGNNNTLIQTHNLGISLVNDTVVSLGFNDDNVSISLDGVLKGYIEDWNNIWNNGTIGFMSGYGGNVSIDDFIAYTDDVSSPSITSSSPSTPTTSFVNESKIFNAGSDQSGNWTWLLDSIPFKSSETDTANGTYTNSTAPNGTTINVTAIITNVNGSAQTSWSWTPLQNYITSNVTYSDGTNSTIVHIVNVSYYTPGTTQWGFNFSWTDNGQQYDWTYTNDTIIQSLTAGSTNETLEFLQPTLPTGIYYIQKSSVTIETFVVAVGAFTTVVVAGAAVVSKRVRRGISGFWNRRIRRR